MPTHNFVSNSSQRISVPRYLLFNRDINENMAFFFRIVSVV